MIPWRILAAPQAPIIGYVLVDKHGGFFTWPGVRYVEIYPTAASAEQVAMGEECRVSRVMIQHLAHFQGNEP